MCCTLRRLAIKTTFAESSLSLLSVVESNVHITARLCGMFSHDLSLHLSHFIKKMHRRSSYRFASACAGQGISIDHLINRFVFRWRETTVEEYDDANDAWTVCPEVKVVAGATLVWA